MDEIEFLIRDLGDGDHEDRRFAINAIIRQGSAYVPEIIEALIHGDEFTRSDASYCLKMIGDPAAAPYLAEVLNDSEDSVSENAKEALVKIGKLSVPALIEIMKREDNYLRESAMNVIEEIGPLAIPALAASLKDRCLRPYIALILRKIRDPSAVPALADALADKNFKRYNNMEICSALANIGEMAVPQLIKLLRFKRPDLQMQVAQILETIGLEHVRLRERILCLLFLKRTDEFARLGAEAIPELIRYIEKKEKSDHYANIEAAIANAGVAALPYLIKLMMCEKEWARSRAAEIIIQIKHESMIPALLEILEKGNSGTRVTTLYVLRGLNDHSVAPVVIKRLQDESPLVRAEAAEFFLYINHQEALPSLIQSLQDEDNGVRRAAIRALYGMDGPELLPALIMASKDNDYAVRKSAISALRRIKDPATAPPIIKMLSDADSFIRESAEQAILEMGIRAIPALTEALEDGAKKHDKIPTLINRIFSACRSTQALNEFETAFSEGHSLWAKKHKNGDNQIATKHMLANIKIELAKKRCVLTESKDIILDDIPKPPRKGEMYQRIRRTVRNG